MPRVFVLVFALLLAGCAASRPNAAALPTQIVAASATVRVPSPQASAAPTASAVPTRLATATVLATAAPTLAPTAAPTTTSAPAPASEPVRLVIPAIGLDRTLVAVGLNSQRVPIVPKHDIGWYNLSARPSERENVVLWGHVLRFKSAPKTPAPFARVRELAIGAKLTVYSADGVAHPYAVTRQVWVTPDQVEYILPQGREMITMVSCIGDKVIGGRGVEMTHRLITIAEPVG